ncbi:hypothetical protein, partial [Nocardia ninae]|uniref:WXG100-like domain-containing protein n=1 Tax=Nocardia ninae TaxID=356145 RepID=UPI0039EE092B
MADFWDGVVDVLGWVAGSDWPEGSESGMRALGGDWHAAAEAIRGIEADITAAKNAALAAYPAGVARDEIAGVFDKLWNGTGATKEQENQNLKKMAEFFDGIGDSAEQVGDEIEYAKWMMASSLGLLAIELAAAWLFPPTAPAVQVGLIAATRFGIRLIAQRVMAAISRALGRMLTAGFAKFVMKHVAIDLALGTMQDLGIQQMQVWQGHRKQGVDWGQVGMTALSSGLGGAAAGPVGDRLGQALQGKMRPFFAGAVTGMAAGTVGAVAGAIPQFAMDVYKNGWDSAFSNLDPRMFTAGISNGAMSGGNKALANGYFSSSPNWGGGVRVDPIGVPRVGSLGTLEPTGVGAGTNAPGVQPAGANGLGTNGSGGSQVGGSQGSGSSRAGGDGTGTGGSNGRSSSAGDNSTRNSGGTDDGSSSRTSTGDGSSPRSSAADAPTSQSSNDGSASRSDGAQSRGDSGAQQHDGGAQQRESGSDSGAQQRDSGGSSENRGADGGRQEGGSESRAGVAPEHAAGADQSSTTAGDHGGSANDRGAGESGTNGTDRGVAPQQHAGGDVGAPPPESRQTGPQQNSLTSDPARTGGDGSQPRSGVPGEARPHTSGAEPARSTDPGRSADPARAQSGAEPRTGDSRASSPETRQGGDRPRVDSRAGVAETNPRAADRGSSPGIRAESGGSEAPRTPERSTGAAGEHAKVRAESPDGPTAVRPEAGVPRHEAGAPRPEAGAPRQETGAPRPDDAAPRPDDVAPRPDDNAPRSEDGVQRPEDAAPQPDRSRSGEAPRTGRDPGLLAEGDARPRDESSAPRSDEDPATRPDDADSDRRRGSDDPALVPLLVGPDGSAPPARHPGGDAPRADGSPRPEGDTDSGETPRPRGDDDLRGKCGLLSVVDLIRRFGAENFRLPTRTIGVDGMTAGELVAAAGGSLREFRGADAIANRLMSLGEGATALVVDVYSGPADRHGVGAHAYLMVHENGQIVIRDATLTGDEGGAPTRDVSRSLAILFNGDGTPIDPVPSHVRDELMAGGDHPVDPVRIGQQPAGQQFYRGSDAQWHHPADPDNTWRDGRFRLHDYRTGQFIEDHLSTNKFTFLADQGPASPYHPTQPMTLTDSLLQDQLHDLSQQRLDLQTERDGVADDLVKRLIPEFSKYGLSEIPELKASKLDDVISDLKDQIRNDSELSSAEKVAKLALLRDLQATAENYNDLGPRMVQVSKDLGELGARAWGLDRALHPDAVNLTDFPGAKDGPDLVDLAVLVPDPDGGPPKLVIIEAKGVGSGLGGANTVDGRAQQGSPEYLRRTLAMDANLKTILTETPEALRARGIDLDSPAGRDLLKAREELLKAHHDGTLKIEYHKVHVDIHGKIKVSEFGLNPSDRAAVRMDTIGEIQSDHTPAQPASPDNGGGPHPRSPDDQTSQPDDRRGRCGEDSLIDLRDRHGDQIWLPERTIGPDGMTSRELEALAGGELRPTDHDTVRQRLLELGDGSSALIVDTYASRDEYGVGAHAYEMLNVGGDIIIRDIGAGLDNHSYPPRTPQEVRGTRAIVLGGPEGRPDHPISHADRIRMLEAEANAAASGDRVGRPVDGRQHDGTGSPRHELTDTSPPADTDEPNRVDDGRRDTGLPDVEVIGEPGPGVTPEMLDAARRSVAETGEPLVIFGSRQTGISEKSGAPFHADSDLDVAATTPEGLMKLVDVHEGQSPIPKVKDVAGIFSEQQAREKGYLVIKPAEVAPVDAGSTNDRGSKDPGAQEDSGARPRPSDENGSSDRGPKDPGTATADRESGTRPRPSEEPAGNENGPQRDPDQHRDDALSYDDHLSNSDEPPRPAPSSFIIPDNGGPLPEPSVQSHPLGTLDESRVTRDADTGLITHVDAEPVDDFVRRLGAERADAYRQAATDKVLSRNAQGACMSVGIDRETGRVYEAANGKRSDVIAEADLHPTLVDNLRRMESQLYSQDADPNVPATEKYPHPDDPLGHAEVKATNQMLWDRRAAGLSDDHSAMAALLHAPQFPFGGRAGDAPFCANCHHMLAGAESATDRHTKYPPADATLQSSLDRAARDGAGPSKTSETPPVGEVDGGRAREVDPNTSRPQKDSAAEPRPRPAAEESGPRPVDPTRPQEVSASESRPRPAADDPAKMSTDHLARDRESASQLTPRDPAAPLDVTDGADRPDGGQPESSIVDKWTPMDATQVGEELAKDTGLLVYGFDQPGVDPAVAREIARGVVEMRTKYPHVALGSVGIGPFRHRTLAQVMPAINPETGARYAQSIKISRDFVGSLDTFRQEVQLGVNKGRFDQALTNRPVFQMILHEYGHVVDFHGQRASLRPIDPSDPHSLTYVDKVLQDHYKQLAAQDPTLPNTKAGYDNWLSQLSRYSFDVNGVFNPGEAVADAFRDVELNGDRASEPAQVMHKLLTDLAELGPDALAPRLPSAEAGPPADGARPQRIPVPEGAPHPAADAPARMAADRPRDPDAAGDDSGGRRETTDEWSARMRAETAEWRARMAAEHAVEMRRIADIEPVDWASQMRADHAEWTAQMLAMRAEFSRDIADGVLPRAAEPSSDAADEPIGVRPEGGNKPEPSSEVPHPGDVKVWPRENSAPAPEPEAAGAGGGKKPPESPQPVGDPGEEGANNGRRPGEDPTPAEGTPRPEDTIEARQAALNAERDRMVAERDALLQQRNELAGRLGVSSAADWIALHPDLLQRTLEELRGRTMEVREEMPRELARIDQLEQLVNQVADKNADIARIDSELARLAAEREAAIRRETPTAEYDRLLEERRELARERESARVKRDELADRLGIRELSGDAFERRMLELYDEARTRRTRIPGTLDSPEQFVRERVSGADVEQHNRTVRRLVDAVAEFNRLDAAVADTDARLAQLHDAGIGRDRPSADDLTGDLDRMAREHAEILRDIEARRSLMADLARSLGIPESDLGPQRHQLEETLRDQRNRITDNTDASVERHRLLDALHDAARDVLAADNAAGRLQDEMARVTGLWRDLIVAEGGKMGRMVNDRVGIIFGERPRIIVFGPRAEFDNPRAGHDRDLAHAILTEPVVAHAMMRQPRIEYRQVVTEPDGSWQQVPMRGPAMERIATGWIDGDPGLLLVRWQDASGQWHAVDPTKAEWRGEVGRKPKDEKDPGDPDWWGGLGDFGNDLATPFADIPPGQIARNMLPMNPIGATITYFEGGIPPEDIATVHAGSDFYAVQRNLRTLLDVVKVPMVRDWIHRHPAIGDWIKARPWLQRLPPFSTQWSSVQWHRPPETNIQPMVRRWDADEHSNNPQRAEIAEWLQRAIDRDVANWRKVQEWADEEYDKFRRDDQLADRMVEPLNEYREQQRRVGAQELVDRIRKELVDSHEGVDLGRPDVDRQLAMIDQAIDLIARDAFDKFPTDDPAEVRNTVADIRKRLLKIRNVGPITDADITRIVDELTPGMRPLLPKIEDHAKPDPFPRGSTVEGEQTPPRPEYPEFTRDQVQQIINHLMHDEHLARDYADPDARLVWVRMDQLADVAEAITRIVDGKPRPEDVVLMLDALAESNFLRDPANEDATWHEANAHAIAEGFHWDANRPPLTGPRAGIPYAPEPLSTPESLTTPEPFLPRDRYELELAKARVRWEATTAALFAAAQAARADPDALFGADDPAAHLADLRAQQPDADGQRRIDELTRALEAFDDAGAEVTRLEQRLEQHDADRARARAVARGGVPELPAVQAETNALPEAPAPQETSAQQQRAAEADAQQRRDEINRLEREKAEALRVRDEAEEQLRQARDQAEAEDAFERQRHAVRDAAELDRLLTEQLRDGALLEAGAQPIAEVPQVGVIPGDPRQVAVVVRGESADPTTLIDRAVALHPDLADLVGPNRDNAIVFRLVPGEDGRTQVHRNDPPDAPPLAAPRPEPDAPSDGGAAKKPPTGEAPQPGDGPSTPAPKETAAPSKPGEEPGAQAQKPVGEANTPSGEVSKPVGEAKKPVSEPNVPAGEANKPAGTAGKPVAEAGRPVAEAPEPSTDSGAKKPPQPPASGEEGNTSHSHTPEGAVQPGDPGSNRPPAGAQPGQWSTVGDPRPYDPTTRTPEFEGLVDRITASADTGRQLLDQARAMLRALGADPDGLDPHALEQQARDVLNSAKSRAEELQNRAHVPSEEMVQYFDDLRAAQQHYADSARATVAVSRALNQYHESVRATHDLRAEAAAVIARDVLATEGQPLPGSDGVAILPGDPQRVLVASPFRDPEHVIGADLRETLAQQGVEVIYRQVLVDDQGQVSIVDLVPPSGPDPQGGTNPQTPPPAPGSGTPGQPGGTPARPGGGTPGQPGGASAPHGSATPQQPSATPQQPSATPARTGGGTPEQPSGTSARPGVGTPARPVGEAPPRAGEPNDVTGTNKPGEGSRTDNVSAPGEVKAATPEEPAQPVADGAGGGKKPPQPPTAPPAGDPGDDGAHRPPDRSSADRPSTSSPDAAAIARAVARVEAAPTSGERLQVQVLSEGALLMAERVELITLDDGTQLIRKTLSNPRHADAEVLAALVGRAVGANVPHIVRVSDNMIYMQVMPGDWASALHPGAWSPQQTGLTETPGGVRLGLLDVLIRMPDRGMTNWLVTPDGLISGIDHSLAFGNGKRPDAETSSGFAHHFFERGPDGTLHWRQHDLSAAELAEIRRRIEALAPEFAQHPDWHQSVLDRLTTIEQNARPDSDPPQPGSPSAGPDKPGGTGPQRPGGPHDTSPGGAENGRGTPSPEGSSDPAGTPRPEGPPQPDPAAVRAADDAERRAELIEARDVAIRDHEVALRRRNELAEFLGVDPADDWAALRPGDTLADTLRQLNHHRIDGPERLPHDMIRVKELERLSNRVPEAAATIERLNAELAALDAEDTGPRETREAEYDRLLDERAERARDREAARATRDDLAARLNVTDLTGDAFDRRVLELHNEARTKTVRVRGNLDSPGRVAHEPVAGPEREMRERTIRRMVQAVEEFNRLDQVVDGIDTRLNELHRENVNRDRPLADNVVAALDRLAREQAAIFQHSRPRRTVLEDLAERLDVPLSELGPDPRQLAETMRQQRGIEDDTDPDRQSMLDELEAAAIDVIRSDTAMTRLQEQMTQLTERWHEVVEWRDTLRAEGGRMATDRVGIIDGEPPRIVVFGQQPESARPHALHDAALEHAIRTSSSIAQAMLRHPRIEYRQTTPGGETVVHPGPPLEHMATGWINGDPGVLAVRWRDGEGNWRWVDPTRPDWSVNVGEDGKLRRGADLESYDPGDPDWWAGLADYINDLATPFADIPPGQMAKNMLPMNPMNVPVKYFQGDIPDDALVNVHIGSDFYAIQRDIRTLLAAIDHPAVRKWIQRHPAIGDWVKARPWLQKLPPFGTVWSGFDWHKPPETNIQPMFRDWEASEHSRHDLHVEIPEWLQQVFAREAAEWQRVQDWADGEYDRFRADDQLADKIADQLARYGENQQAAAARKVIDLVRKELVDAHRGIDPTRPDVAEQLNRVDRQIEDLAERTLAMFDSNDPIAVRDTIADIRNLLVDAQNAGRITDEQIDEIARELAPNMWHDATADRAVPPPHFTREQIQQILDHLMKDEHLVTDYADPSGRVVRRRMDQLADVAEAINRLVAGEPLKQDIVLLYDALAESEFLRDPENWKKTWHDANTHAVALGFHWDADRPPLTGWRKDIPYAATPLPETTPFLPRDRYQLALSEARAVLDARTDALLALEQSLGIDPAWLFGSSEPIDTRLAQLRAEQPDADAARRVDDLARAFHEFEDAAAEVRRHEENLDRHDTELDRARALERSGQHELSGPVTETPQGDRPEAAPSRPEAAASRDGDVHPDPDADVRREVAELRERLELEVVQAQDRLDRAEAERRAAAESLSMTIEPHELRSEPEIETRAEELRSRTLEVNEQQARLDKVAELERAAKDYLAAEAEVARIEEELGHAETRAEELTPSDPSTGDRTRPGEQNANPQEALGDSESTRRRPRGSDEGGSDRDRAESDAEGAEPSGDSGSGQHRDRGTDDDDSDGADRDRTPGADLKPPVFRSHIPHPPHEFELDFPPPVVSPLPPTAPMPDLPEHKEPPRPPVPPQPPTTPVPPRRPSPTPTPTPTPTDIPVMPRPTTPPTTTPTTTS